MKKIPYFFALSCSFFLIEQASALELTTYVTEWSGYGSNDGSGYPAYPFDGSYPNAYHDMTVLKNPDMVTKAQQSNVLAFAFLQTWNPDDPMQAKYAVPAEWKGQLHFDDVWGDLPNNAAPEYAQWQAICRSSSHGTCAAL